MSLDLDIKITENIKIKQMLFGCHKELVKLCRFEEIPQLEIFKLQNGLKSKLPDKYTLIPGETFVIQFKDTLKGIYLTITEIKSMLPYIGKDEAGIWGGISVQGENKSKFLLSAGMALYLSNYCKSKIIDERCFWTNEHENTYERFLFLLKAELIQNNIDFELVCRNFYDKLPKGKADANFYEP